MSMQAIVRGRVLAGPFRSETQSAELTVTMTLGDNQSALHRGREYLIDDLEVSEIICRGPWAAQVAESIFEGDADLFEDDLSVVGMRLNDAAISSNVVRMWSEAQRNDSQMAMAGPKIPANKGM